MNSIKKLINVLDDNMFKCRKCKKWFIKSKIYLISFNFEIYPYCRKCAIDNMIKNIKGKTSDACKNYI